MRISDKIEQRLISFVNNGVIKTQDKMDEYITAYFNGLADAEEFPSDVLETLIEETRKKFSGAFFQPFYFTFGSWEKYPFQDGYLVIYAEDIKMAALRFMELYPNPSNPEVLNCADYYSQREWIGITKTYYKGRSPFQVIGKGGFFYEYNR